MLIMTEGEGSVLLHKRICEKCLVGRFDIDWRDEYTCVSFTTETKYHTYYEVNKAAEFFI